VNKKNIVLLVLLFCVLGRLVVSPLPTDESLTTSADQGAYLHFSWFLNHHSSEAWNQFWYSGFPSFIFYPQGIFLVQSLLSNLMSDILAFKLVLSLCFALAPIAFYYLLKEFTLSIKGKITAMLVFSFVFYYNASAYFGKTPALSSVLFGLVFFKFFIRSIKRKNYYDLAISSVFLAATILTHSLTAFMYMALAAVYLIAVLWIKFDLAKLLRAIGIGVSGLAMSASWLIPAILERKYLVLSGAYGAEATIFNTFPLTGIIRTFGFYVNAFTVGLSAIALVLICFGVWMHYNQYTKKRNAESLFLILSALVFVLGYFIFYFVKIPFQIEAAVILWPLFLSIIIAKTVDTRLLSYLAAIFIVLQLVLFFGMPMDYQGKTEYTKFDQAFKYLEDKGGRISIQPYAPYKLATIVDYRPPLFGKETEFGLCYACIPEARSNYVYSNLGFDCIMEEDNLARILSTDFFDRRYIKTKECKLANPDLYGYFQNMDVHYVIVDKEFPEVDRYFENQTGEYNKVYEQSAFSIYKLVTAPDYVQTGRGVTYSYSKSSNKIIINLHSDVRYHNLDVKISETWYPHWASTDVVNIRADEDGFMVFTVPELYGDKTIMLEFKQPDFYNYLPFISIAWLIGIMAFTGFDYMKKSAL
jgi:hypothetical protein